MPPILTSPSALASGLVSCMRLRQRIKVDLPHPEGPITAVAWVDSTAMSMPCRASVWPNQALRLRTSTAVAILAGPSQHTPQEQESHYGGRPDNQNHQRESPRPGLAVPLVKGGNGIGENLQWQCGNGLTGAEAPELIAEGGKQQR